MKMTEVPAYPEVPLGWWFIRWRPDTKFWLMIHSFQPKQKR